MYKRLSIKYLLIIFSIILIINYSPNNILLLFNSLFLILLVYITISPYPYNNIGNIIEYTILLTLIILLYIMNNLISLYICIELLNICIYIYAFRKYSIQNNINIINYYIISSISSILLLYSLLYLYIYTGDINLYNIINIIPYINPLPIYLFIISIIIKLGSGPFYLYKVELYNQLNIIQLLLFSTIPIYIYYYLFTYFIYYFNNNNIQYNILTLLYSLIIIALVISSIDYFIINKMNILFIYSSIYNTALLLFNIALFIINNNYNIYIYLLIYLLNIIGIMQLLNISKKDNNIPPIYKFISLIYFFSFIGFPPLGGFFSKLYLLSSSLYFGNSSLLYIFFTILIILSTLLIASLYIKFIDYYYFNEIITLIPISFPEAPNMKYELNYNLIYAIISISFLSLSFSILILPYCPL